MENFKFITISAIILIALGILGFWAFGTLESGEKHVAREKEQALEEKNKELEKEIERLKDELAVLSPKAEEPKETQIEEPKEETQVSPTQTPTTYKHQTLINELEGLIKDGVQMKLGSRGTRVGTVQKFLNLFNNTTNKIDNDYGKSTKTAVANFQKAVGLTQSGEAGKATFEKMIEWLKKQG